MNESKRTSVPAISYRPIGHIENVFEEPIAGERIRAVESRMCSIRR